MDTRDDENEVNAWGSSLDRTVTGDGLRVEEVSRYARYPGFGFYVVSGRRGDLAGVQIRIQPCFSPVWDTGIALHALAEAGMDATSPVPRKTVEWLLAKECRVASDWAKNCPDVEASGWYFEYLNPHYPDVDDTAVGAVVNADVG